MRIEKQNDGSYFVYVWDKIEAHIQAATPEQLKIVEDFVFNECSPYLGKITAMEEAEFKDFLNEKAMSYDVERGILPGMVPHRIYEHTEWFKEFETKLWQEIEERMERCSYDLF